MRRREFIAFLSSIVASSHAARAQQEKKIWRLVIIGSAPWLRNDFPRSLAEAGYENGKNISLQHHVIAPQLTALEGAIPRLTSNVDLLVVGSTIAQ